MTEGPTTFDSVVRAVARVGTPAPALVAGQTLAETYELIDRFVGWWCQEPTRMGPEYAGRVELHFVRGDNRILIEGTWTYGDGKAAAWQNNFYGVSLEQPRDSTYKLEQRLQHLERCPGH